MIKSFGNPFAEAAWERRFRERPSRTTSSRLPTGSLFRSTVPANWQTCARRRGKPAGSAVGDRKGQHSVRINDQWRICFRWSDGDAHDVEIVALSLRTEFMADFAPAHSWRSSS